MKWSIEEEDVETVGESIIKINHKKIGCASIITLCQPIFKGKYKRNVRRIIMGQEILNVLEENLNLDLMEIIISNSSNKDKMSKIKIRPIMLKNRLVFQIESFVGKQVFHNNVNKEELISKCKEWFSIGLKEDKIIFRQIQIQTHTEMIHILISKKGKVTVRSKKIQNKEEKGNFVETLAHNRKKAYILEEGRKVPFLVDLGVMTPEGQIIRSKYDKYRQINRFLEYVEDILPNFNPDREITIIDFGCGKSYLTFAIYYYLRELKGYNIQMIGLDLKEEVIKKCNDLSKRYGYEKLRFLYGDIASFEGADSVDMVVTLHACDTATDHALYKAIKWGAKVILSVPCCQHELNHQMNCKQLDHILDYGLIKERTAALLTDALRGNLLEAVGYKTQILEFIDMEHTPKNILIRAVKNSQGVNHLEAQVKETMKFFGVNPTLYQLLKEDMEVKLC